MPEANSPWKIGELNASSLLYRFYLSTTLLCTVQGLYYQLVFTFLFLGLPENIVYIFLSIKQLSEIDRRILWQKVDFACQFCKTIASKIVTGFSARLDCLLIIWLFPEKKQVLSKKNCGNFRIFSKTLLELFRGHGKQTYFGVLFTIFLKGRQFFAQPYFTENRFFDVWKEVVYYLRHSELLVRF